MTQSTLELREDRRTEILNRAAELFAAEGVGSTSMVDIARAVGIQKASLYHFFASKEDLLVQVLRPVVERPHDELAKIVRGDGDVQSRVVEAMAALGREFERNPDRMQILVRERLHRHLPDEQFSQVVRLKSAYTNLWCELLREGVATGVFRPVDDQTTAFALIGSLNWMHAWFSPDGARSGDEIGRGFARLFINGLRVPSAADNHGVHDE